MGAVSRPQNMPVTTLKLSVTGECNLSCFYCKPLGRARELKAPEKLIAPADYGKIARAAVEAGIETIMISGGEPLLRKDIASVVKSVLTAKKLPRLRFITNGTYLKTYADGLRRAGLRNVEVNIDSLNFVSYQKIARLDGLYRVLDGLSKAERVKFDSIIMNIFVLNGINNQELIDFAVMTKDKPYDLRFIEYTAYEDRENQMHRSLLYPSLYTKRIIDDFEKLWPEPKADDFIDTEDWFRFKKGAGRVSFRTATDYDLTYEEPKLVFLATGELRNELHWGKSANLLKELEKDNHEDRLVKVIQKMMQPPTKKTITTTKRAPAKPRTTAARGRATTSSQATSASA